MSNTFSCGQCGKQYPWKTSIAGKKAKCACGHIMVVPQSAPAAEDDEGLYDIAEPVPAPAPAAHPMPAARPSLAYAVEKPQRVSSSSLVDPMRDIYVPAGVLIAGFLAIFAWAIVDVRLPLPALAIISVAAGAATAIKTAILIGIALVAAPMMGISFGTLRTAILKFAAIIIFTDAALLWLDVILEAIGAMPVHGRPVRGTWMVTLSSAAVIITLLTHYLFDMDWDETAEIALPMAVLSRLIGFFMTLVLIAVLEGMMAARTPAPAGAPAGGSVPGTSTPGGSSPGIAAPGGGPAAPVAVTTINETAADRALGDRLKKRDPFLREAGDQMRMQSRRINGQRELTDGAYAAGARKVYCDLRGSPKLEPTRAYVELPAETAARTACFAAIQSACQQYKFSADDLTDNGQRFVTIDLKR